jgi:hypothetical protein
MPYLASNKVRNRPLGPAYSKVVSTDILLIITHVALLTPITTTSRFSSALEALLGRGESLGNGGARDGRILRSLAALEVSWKTGMLYVTTLSSNFDFKRSDWFDEQQPIGLG